MRTRGRSELTRRLGQRRPVRQAPWGEAAAVAAPGPAVSRRRGELGGPQDVAVYGCHCGLVFEAPVSTSVDCPHCGDAQAW